MFQLEKVYQNIEIPKNLKKTDLTYDLIKPFIKTHVHFNGTEIVYDVMEPKFTKEELEIFNKIYKYA